MVTSLGCARWCAMAQKRCGRFWFRVLVQIGFILCLALCCVCARSLLVRRGWYAQTRDVISTSLGSVLNVVVFAFMLKATLDVAVAAARITPTGAPEARAWTLVEVVQLGFIWRWSRRHSQCFGRSTSRHPARYARSLQRRGTWPSQRRTGAGPSTP